MLSEVGCLRWGLCFLRLGRPDSWYDPILLINQCRHHKNIIICLIIIISY